MKSKISRGLTGIVASAILAFGSSSRADDYMLHTRPDGSFEFPYAGGNDNGCSVGSVYDDIDIKGEKKSDTCTIRGKTRGDSAGKVYHITLGDHDEDRLDIIRYTAKRKKKVVENKGREDYFMRGRVIPHPKKKEKLKDYLKYSFHGELRLREIFSRNHLDDNKESKIRGDMSATGRYDSYTEMDLLLFDTLIIGGSWGTIGDNIDAYKDSHTRWDFQDSIRLGVYKKISEWYGSLTYEKIFGSAGDFYRGGDKEIRLSIGRKPDERGVYFSDDLIFGKRRYLSPSVSIGNETKGGFFFDNGVGLMMSLDTYFINRIKPASGGDSYSGVDILPRIRPEICFKKKEIEICGGPEYSFNEDSPFDIFTSITLSSF